MASSDQPTSGHHAFRLIGMGLVVIACVALGIIWLRHAGQNGSAQPPQEARPQASLLFRDWDTPAIAIVLTGQMHGYLQPCGCSDPQYGGLARRYNFVRSLKDKGWPVVALDLGDLAAHSGPQDMVKFDTTIKALDLMGYTAIGLGKNEFYLKLLDIQGFKVNYKPAEPPYLVSSNLEDSHNLIKTWVVADGAKPAVGVACLIGPSVLQEVKKFPQVKFSPDGNGKIVHKLLKDIAGKNPGIIVLLYQGTEKEARACAEFCATARNADKQLPKVNVILHLENEEEPSGVPQKVGDTLLLGVGHKSRNLGVVGVFPAAAPGSFDFKYQLVSIGPEYETPKGQDNANPVLALMEKYAQEVKNGNFLGQFPRSKHPMQLAYPNAKYVGSGRCGQCHDHAFNVWKKTGHFRAFDALVNAKRPSGRQFDGECVVCHTVGFEHLTGYADKNNTVKRNTLLEHVGCESCHGPGSVHENNPNNRALYPLMNPYKAKAGEGKAAQLQRLNQLDKFCQKCHDIDNDVHWGKEPFAAKWKSIAHPTPRNGDAVNGTPEESP